MILQNIKYIDGGIAICGDLIIDEIDYIVSEWKGYSRTEYRDVIHICLTSKAINKCFIFALRLDNRVYRLKKLQTKKKYFRLYKYL